MKYFPLQVQFSEIEYTHLDALYVLDIQFLH